MSFVDLYSEMVGRLPGLSPFLAETFIQRAWREIRDERQWSFLQEICAIVCPVQVVAGTLSITQFSATVLADATASAALLAIALPAPLDLTAIQLRFGGTGNTSNVGQVYSIASVDQTDPTALIITLDRIQVQPTNAASGYQAYRCYIKPTVDDFLNWTSFVDMTNGWSLKRNLSSQIFDVRDPQRQAQGMAYYLGSFLGNPGTQPKPQYELWPHPTSGQAFLGRFRRRGENFNTAADVQTEMIPDSLIMIRALGWHGYPWAHENIGRIPQLKGTNWVQEAINARAMYPAELTRAKRQDDEQELQTVWNRGHGLVHGVSAFKGMVNFPIDAAFMQSHLLNF